MDPPVPPPSGPSANPPSVEIAYKRKCIELKKRLNEIETENEVMRTRNRRGHQYIQKMRLESCLLLERLAKVTGMTEEAEAGNPSPEFCARAAALMSNAASVNGLGSAARAGNGVHLDDESEGSSVEQPPTVGSSPEDDDAAVIETTTTTSKHPTKWIHYKPEERPLRVKRSRKSNANADGEDDNPGHENSAEHADGDAGPALPRLAPAPTQQDLSSSFRVQGGSNGTVNDGESTPAAASSHSHENREAQLELVHPDSGATQSDVGVRDLKMEDV
ncbi:hypothetical protein N7495_000413 [Penicillium taxi]|uniref:uncharacterized protein n=1 Tax=Penicillium taxi TaxID=168475 RepID=UPI002544E5D6|nr:uncharacterized protein N7495_000413 [Penicillium taxi]KAJ5907731.1 hypothetical protein N7495_000413 [Penicillium taxi]